MSEETELQAKIAALAGEINKHKRQSPAQETALHGSAVHNGSHHPRSASRWLPYPAGRSNFKPVRNRTLVVASTGSDPSSSDERDSLGPSAPSYVTSPAGSDAQVMTKETFEREQRLRQGYKQQRAVTTTRAAPQPLRRNVQGTRPPNQVARILEFDGIKFELQPDGGKLIRLPGEPYVGPRYCTGLNIADPEGGNKETPKKVTIAEVDFLRTKSGNLVRTTTTTQGNMRYRGHDHNSAHGQFSQPARCRADVRASQKQCDKFTRHGTVHSRIQATSPVQRTLYDLPWRLSGRPAVQANLDLGNCPFGPSCRNRHDPSKIAICKEFFAKGSCAAGKSCDLSHEPDYHRVPACTYFLRGNCTNSACRYAHVVDVHPSALVCRAFATLGYCSKGIECGNRHVFECPDYTNHGHCEAHQQGLCMLPHVDRASTLRKAAKRRGNAGSEDASDLSSDEEEQTTEIDNDSDIEITLDADGDSHELTQQQDYIEFSPYGRAQT